MSAYYTTNLNTLWIGYLNSSAYGYKGILLSLNFDLYSENNKIIKS